MKLGIKNNRTLLKHSIVSWEIFPDAILGYHNIIWHTIAIKIKLIADMSEARNTNKDKVLFAL